MYSDYTIECKDYTAKVHKLVLHVHSKFFATAFSSNFREGQAGNNVMQLPDDDPAVVRAMIDYFYSGRYSPSGLASPLAFQAKVFVIADKYECDALEALAFNCAVGLCRGGCIYIKPVDVIEMVKAVEDVVGLPKAQKLKDLAIDAMMSKLPQLLREPDFQLLLQGLPEWNIALLRAMYVRSSRRNEDWRACLVNTRGDIGGTEALRARSDRILGIDAGVGLPQARLANVQGPREAGIARRNRDGVCGP